MHNIRRALGLLMAFVLPMFAAPGFAGTAPTKMFSVTLSAAPPSGGKQVVTATFFNQTPSGGNSTINSVILYAPTSPPNSSALKIVNASTPNGGTAIIASDGTSVSVINMPGIKAGQTPPAQWSMTVTLDASTAPACTSTNFTWPTPYASTGNTPTTVGGVPFQFQPQLSNITTSLSSPCKYSLSVTPSPVTAGTSSQSMTATFTNPSSNSASFGSLSLTAPSGFTIASATPPSGTATVAADRSSVSVAGISVAPNSTFALTINVNLSCSAATGNWGSTVWTGSPVSTGTQVTFDSGSSSIQTSVTAGCSFKFLTQPSNAERNTAISPAIVVGLVDASNNVVTSFTGQVTLSKKSGPGTVSGTLGPTAAVNGQATFNGVQADTPGNYILTATSGALTVDSNLFAIYYGKLYCNPTPPFTFNDPNVTVTDPNASGYAAGSRGYWNKDGMNCVPILYTFTNTILNNDATKNTVHLAWDTSTQQHPAFTYSMTWQAEDVDNPSKPDTQGPANYGWPVLRHPYVYWLPTDATVTTIPAGAVPALACVSDDLPAPYAMLDADIGTSTTSIVVDVPPIKPTGFPASTLPAPGDSTASPPTLAPFPIVIDMERMKVTKLAAGPNANQYTLTVVRGDGSTQPAAHVAFAAANQTAYNTTGQTYVMSTPLPIDSNPGSPNYNMQVPVCVVNHGWMAAGSNPVTGIPQVRWFTTVFDIGDAWVQVR